MSGGRGEEICMIGWREEESYNYVKRKGRGQMIGWREVESYTHVRRKGRGKMFDRLEGRGKLYLCQEEGKRKDL